MEVATTDWQAEALRLKGEGWSSASIAEAVGKHPATVRKVINRVKEAEPAGPVAVEVPEGGYPPIYWVHEDDDPDVPVTVPASIPAPIPGQIDIAGREAEAADARDAWLGKTGDAYLNGIPSDNVSGVVEDFKAEAGEPTGPLQTRPGEEPAADDVFGDEPHEILVAGTTQLGLFDAGGVKPTTASIRLQGGKIGLMHGQAFRKGDLIHFSGTALVVEVAGRDKVDKATHEVKDCEQKHVALITDLEIT